MLWKHYERILLSKARAPRTSQWFHLPLLLLLAAGLRLYRLAAKPLWVDEIYTAFYSLGKSLEIIPFGELLPPETYWALISDPGTPWQAAQAVATYSNHPPLFFMLMNGWLQSVGTSVWSLRAFAVLWGLVAVAGVFYLGRRVAGDHVGQLAALLMAVSPYGIYLSQEARHYSMAMAIATFALLNWIALLQGDRTLFRWLSWIGLNALGLYVHYFYSFGIAAQWLVTAIVLLRRLQNRSQTLKQTVAQAFGWLLAIVSTALVYLPWVPSAIAHLQSDGGTSWLSHDLPLYQTVLYPLVQTLAAAVFMLAMLPVEQMPLWVVLPSALIMLGVFGVVIWQFIQGWQNESKLQTSQLYASLDTSLDASRFAKGALVSYSLVVLAIMMLITYGLGKDLTRAPRYFFMLYPAVSVLLATGLRRRRFVLTMTNPPPHNYRFIVEEIGLNRRHWVLTAAIAAGILSQILISYDLALLKPFLPGQVGRRIAAESAPTAVLITPGQDSYRALSLSYILAIPPNSSDQIALLPESASANRWQPSIDGAPPKDAVLWLVEPKREIPFPTEVAWSNQTCSAAGEQISTEGTRQQKYRCIAAASDSE